MTREGGRPRPGILFLCNSPHGGGAEIWVRRVALGLRDRGSRVVVAAARGGWLAETIPGDGIPFIPLDAGPVLNRRDALAFVRGWRGSRRDLMAAIDRARREHGVEVVHLGLTGEKLLVGGASPVPVVWTEHGPLPTRFARSPLMYRYRRAARAASVVHCVSEATAAHLRCAGFPGDHLRTIHVGLDLTPGTPERARDLRRDLGFADRDVVVGAVGRLVWVKGLETLLDAAARLAPRHPRLRCMIVGDGPLRAPLEARARRLGLDGRVVFTGHRTDVPDLLAAMDIHAAPSVTEGFPMATLEAMHAGLPSVVTDVGGYPEMVADGRTGFLVPPGSVGALAERIERLVDDADMRAAMGAAARDRARSRFDRATFLDRIETLLIEAAAAADAPGVQSLEPIGVGP